MFNLNQLRNFGVPLYLFIYLIVPNSAITETTKVDFRRNLEKALNTGNLEYIKATFRDDESSLIPKKFSKIIQEFPDSKWKIKSLKSNNPSENMFQIKVIGKKMLDKEIYILESNFSYLFTKTNERINKGTVKKLFTIVRNDNKKIDITFKIPDEVLTGAKYDIDIIIDKPLDGKIIAGGIKPHQIDSFLDQEIAIVPLVAGGIFKVTRAPTKPGIQIWSGIIAHPQGMITFTKTIDIIEAI